MGNVVISMLAYDEVTERYGYTIHQASGGVQKIGKHNHVARSNDGGYKVSENIMRFTLWILAQLCNMAMSMSHNINEITETQNTVGKWQDRL